MSVLLHRDAPHHTSSSGADALVAVFDNLCELHRDALTGTTSSEDQDAMESPGIAEDEDTSMTGTGLVHEGDDYDMRILVDSSREFSRPPPSSCRTLHAVDPFGVF